MSELIRQTDPGTRALEIAAEASGPIDYRVFLHGTKHIVIHSIDRYSLDEAWLDHLGIRAWRHVSVSVQGALRARLADQRKIGRPRRGGERSPAPLPDWYDLTHLAYEHAAELGFDTRRGVWQYLPAPAAPDDAYLNIAEALHLRQPMS